MRFKELKEIKLDLFQKVDLELKNAEIAALALLCAVVFGAAFFGGVQAMGDYDEKISQTFRGENVLAAEDSEKESVAADKEKVSLEGKKASEAMSGAAGSVKGLAGRVARARNLAKQRAVQKALRRSGPILSGPTEKLPDGRRVCTGNSDHPERSGAVHVDEDCCADYNETPNPRCYYSPEKMGILKRR